MKTWLPDFFSGRYSRRFYNPTKFSIHLSLTDLQKETDRYLDHTGINLRGAVLSYLEKEAKIDLVGAGIEFGEWEEYKKRVTLWDLRDIQELEVKTETLFVPYLLYTDALLSFPTVKHLYTNYLGWSSNLCRQMFPNLESITATYFAYRESSFPFELRLRAFCLTDSRWGDPREEDLNLSCEDYVEIDEYQYPSHVVLPSKVMIQTPLLMPKFKG